MWSWVLHRISGATIFFFLFVHVLDAAMLRVSPQTYNAVVGDYKTPIVGLMEYGLIAAVLFHGLERNPDHPDRLLVAGPALPTADVLDSRHRLSAAHGPGRRGGGHPRVGAPPMSSPDLQLGRGETAPVRQRSHDRPASLDNPRSPRRRAGIPNFEKFAWLFMRFSGVALVVLAVGHLFIMLMWDSGVYRIDFNFVAQRWASPFWQFWDLALLWLAQLHGGNGLRTIIDDYSRKDSTRFWLNSLLLLSMGFTLVLGTYVLLTFDPNIS